MTTPRPDRKVAVVLDQGSAGPLDIARSAGPHRRVVFVTAAGTLDDKARATAGSLGAVLDVDGADPTAAAAVLERRAPAGITTFSERCLPFTAALAEALGLAFHDRATALALTDKNRQRRALAEAGIDRLRSRAATDRTAVRAALAWIGGPAVVKPLRGEGSAHTHLVMDPTGLPEDLPVGPDRPFVVEEYLPGRDEGEFGDYVSVEALAEHGHITTLGVTGKLAMLPPFREQGQFFPSHLDEAEQRRIADLAGDAARALGVRHGLLHTEIKLTPAGPRLIEVNGRLGGYLHDLYRRARGLDLIALALDVACRVPAPVAAATPDRVHFQHYSVSPPDGGTVRAVRGVEGARQVEGIVGYTAFVGNGTALPPGVMTLPLDLMRGNAPDHKAMLATIDRALGAMTFDIEDSTGVVHRWQPSRAGMSATGRVEAC